MSDVAAIIADLVRAGVDPDLIGRTAAALASREPVKIVDEQAERKRAADRERMRQKRSEENSRATSRDVADIPSSPEVSPHTPLPNPSNHLPPSPPKGGSSPTDRAISIFSEQAERAGIPVPRKLTADRRRKVEARLREHGESVWAEACRKMAESSFCRGENDRGWRADLDFLCQPKSFNGLIEGRYDDRPVRNSTAPPRNDLDRMNAALDSLISGDPNGKPEPHSRTIDASFERRDWRGSEGVVQFPAVSARY